MVSTYGKSLMGCVMIKFTKNKHTAAKLMILLIMTFMPVRGNNFLNCIKIANSIISTEIINIILCSNPTYNLFHLALQVPGIIVILYRIKNKIYKKSPGLFRNAQSLPISEIITEIGNIVQSIMLLSTLGFQQGYMPGAFCQNQFNFQEEPHNIHQIYGLRSKKPLLLSTILIIAILCLYEWKESSRGANSVYKTIL
jgi:hypothetical protein